MKIKKGSDLTYSNMLVTVYGNSGVGKTTFISTFPKPLLIIDCGDRKYNHIKNKKGIYIVDIDEYAELPKLLKSAKLKKFKTIVVDNLSGIGTLAEAEWKGKQMRIQDWGTLAEKLNNVIATMKHLSKNQIVIMVAHLKSYMATDGDDLVLESISVSTRPAVKQMLETQTNVAIMLSKRTSVDSTSDEFDESDTDDVQYTGVVSAIPYYWTNGQGLDYTPKGYIVDPTYKKIFKAIKPEEE